ncbi:CFEM-domain-containing protein [Parathielavia hyrcaniae]|uniref:CFEM-domain-containing protein n=1 Tax=Parathielavia hyrcaniae TaxID=113614 RepID=A0AAN6T1P8_9PEZI|nr:CFEM-domain-containing protein [Parathielavia hyrcaniae]
MKTTVTAILALAGAATVAATDFPDNFPECAKLCVENMYAKADELGCGQNDVNCLCSNMDFGYGIRDCSAAVCENDVEQVNAAISYYNNVCSNAGVTSASLSSSTSAPVSFMPPPGLVARLTLGIQVTVTVTSTDSSVTEDPATAITTSTWTSVFTSGEDTTTLTGETVISGISGVAGATTIPSTTVTSPIVSTLTEGSSTFETTVGTTTMVSSMTGDALSSALSSQASEATETSTSSAQVCGAEAQ